MSTSAISNVFSVLPTPANGAGKQNSNPTDAGAFGQVLSREMNDRGTTASANSTKKDTSANNGDKAKNDANTPPQASPNESTKVSEGDKTADTKTEAKVDESEVDTSAAAELAAFVAALTQANPAPATTAPAAVSEEALTGAKKVATADSGVELKAETRGASVKEAAGKAEDFVAALDKAEVKKEIAQTIKTIDTSNASTPQQLAATNAAATLQQLNEAKNQQASNRLTPQVGTQGWDQALGQKVVWMVQGLQQTATLTLNPPDLGPMQVTVNVQNNQATANFTAPQPEVRHALEAAMPRLREMLNEAGIQLGESNVSAGSSSQQGNAFAESRQNGRGNDPSSTVEATPTISHIPTPSGGTGMVDTFA